MSTLTEFLLARIAEDEQAANEATDGPWRYDPTKVNAIDRGEAVFAGETGANATTIASTGPPYDMQSMFDAVHIARHDPARVLAECEAKRAIVFLSEHGCGDDYQRVQQALALPYADRPGYRLEWKP